MPLISCAVTLWSLAARLLGGAVSAASAPAPVVVAALRLRKLRPPVGCVGVALLAELVRVDEVCTSMVIPPLALEPLVMGLMVLLALIALPVLLLVLLAVLPAPTLPWPTPKPAEGITPSDDSAPPGNGAGWL